MSGGRRVPALRLERRLAGKVRLHVHGVYHDLHDYELVQLAREALRQLEALTPEQRLAAETAAAGLSR